MEIEKVAEQDNGIAEGDELVVRFRKPYQFEGKEYPEVDLSNLDNLTARDLMAIGRQVGRVQGGTVVAPELNPEYTVAIAARVASLPLEFFYGLPAREFVKVRGAVTGFLFA